MNTRALFSGFVALVLALPALAQLPPMPVPLPADADMANPRALMQVRRAVDGPLMALVLVNAAQQAMPARSAGDPLFYRAYEGAASSLREAYLRLIPPLDRDYSCAFFKAVDKSAPCVPDTSDVREARAAELRPLVKEHHQALALALMQPRIATRTLEELSEARALQLDPKQLGRHQRRMAELSVRFALISERVGKLALLDEAVLLLGESQHPHAAKAHAAAKELRVEWDEQLVEWVQWAECWVEERELQCEIERRQKPRVFLSGPGAKTKLTALGVAEWQELPVELRAVFRF